MFKLALDAGHGLYTAGKRCLKSLDPNETREWILNSRICEKTEDKLAAYDGIEILRMDDPSGRTDISLAERCRKANAWGADYYLSIHHNAGIAGGSGGGFEVYRYIKLSENGETARKQKIIAESLVAEGVSRGNRSSNIKAADFAVLRDTSMEAALIECGFMDSATDVPQILTDDFAEKVAVALVKAVVLFGNLKLKPIEVPPAANEPNPEEIPELLPQPAPTSPAEEVSEKEAPEQDAESETEKPDAALEENTAADDVNIIVAFFRLLVRIIKDIFNK